jgi:putative sigma-54 modulation protein
MVITIHSTGIEMTDAIKQYATEKMEGLTKYFDNIQTIDIDIGLTSHHHQKGKIYYAECNVSVPNRLVRVVKEAVDLYKAIDKVRDHLKLELKETKGKMREKDREKVRNNKAYQEE